MTLSGSSSFFEFLQVSPAENETDTKRAMTVVEGAFDMGDSQGEGRDFVWYADPNFSFENVLIAKTENDDFAGVVRLIPLTIRRGEESIKVVIFSDVCIDEKFRNQGFSIPMIQSAVKIAKERNFEFALLFARRALDHFYTRFSFWGVSSYSSVAIRPPEHLRNLKKPATLSDFSKDLLELYDRSYRTAFKDYFGRVDRSLEYWDYSIERIRREGISFETVQINGNPTGYIIHSGLKVHEIATQYSADFPAAILALFDNELGKNDTCQLSVSPEHAGFSYLSGSDLTVSHRECRFGGHMVRILNTPFSHKIENRAVPNDEFSYEATLDAFGAAKAGYPSPRPHKHRPFNISLLDQV